MPLYITIPRPEGDVTLPFEQAMKLATLMNEHEGESGIHWHFNACDHTYPCVTLHTPTRAYVIDDFGGVDEFEGPGCEC